MDEYSETTTRLENLPTTVKGLAYHDDDGRCFIVLNARMTHELNQQSYGHELGHIERGELDDPTYLEYQEAAREEVPAPPSPPKVRKIPLRFPLTHENVVDLYRCFVAAGDPDPGVLSWKPMPYGMDYFFYGKKVMEHRPGTAETAKMLVGGCIYSASRLDREGLRSVLYYLQEVKKTIHDGNPYEFD